MAVFIVQISAGAQLGTMKPLHRPLNWLGRIAWRLTPRHPVSILLDQYARERRMRAMLLYTESTFEIDGALKSWLEKAGPDKIRSGPPSYPKGSSSAR